MKQKINDKKNVKTKNDNKKNTNKNKPQEGYVSFFKVIMFFPFLYSGFFWGLIGVYSIYSTEDTDISIFATKMLIGIILLAIALVFTIFDKYFISFPFSVVGLILYNQTTQKLLQGATQSGNVELHDKLEIRHLPIFFFVSIVTILTIIHYVKIAINYKNEKHSRDNAPTKSIIDK